jgi:protein tyrosine phosphatase (PTP) superfamily phosphohydrolase (DUF442 family)
MEGARMFLKSSALAAGLAWLVVFTSEAPANPSGVLCPPAVEKRTPKAQVPQGEDALRGDAHLPDGARGSCPQTLPGLPNFAEVSKGKLYRSAQPTVSGLKLAKARFGIRTVVNFRTIHSDQKEAEALGLQYFRIPFAAWHVTPEDVVRFLRIVNDPVNHPVLVHCQHGADRTGTMVAAYRIFVQGWKAEEAIGELSRFGFHRIYANLKTFLCDEEWRRAAEEAGIARDGLPGQLFPRPGPAYVPDARIGHRPLGAGGEK